MEKNMNDWQLFCVRKFGCQFEIAIVRYFFCRVRKDIRFAHAANASDPSKFDFFPILIFLS
jgi:hypothetical protein